MGKSNKKSNVKVAAVAPTIIPSVVGKKGKRQPEAEVEIQPLPKKLKSATKVPQKKKHETSSSSEDASESEEEVKLPVIKKPNLAKKIPAKGSSSEEEDSSDEEPATKLAAAAKKNPKLAKNGPVSALRNGKAESSDGSESESEEQAQVKKPLQTKVSGKLNFFKGKPVEESSDDDDDSEDEPSDGGSESEESEEEKTVQKVKKTQQPAKIAKKDSSEEDSSDESDDEPKAKQSVQVKKTQQPAKIAKKESSEEDSSDESDDEPKAKQQSVQASKIQQLSKVTKKESKSEDSSDESEEDDDSDESDDEPKKKQSVKAVTPKTPKTPVTLGAKTLFVGNLSFSIDADSIVEFFEDAGEVVDVRLATRDDGKYKGYGHVEFATEEAALKAMDKNGQDLLGRSVRLDFATERGAPGSKQDSKPRNNQQEQKSGCTVFVRGFDKNQEEDDIRNSLTEHFGDCGSIDNIRIPKDYDSGTFKGFAYVEFSDSASLPKALELGTDELSVEEAMARSGGRDGSGRRGGRGFGDGGGGRSFGGRGFGDGGGRFSGGRGRGGGRGTPRGRGDRNGGRGTPKFNLASSGKKTTFGDD